MRFTNENPNPRQIFKLEKHHTETQSGISSSIGNASHPHESAEHGVAVSPLEDSRRQLPLRLELPEVRLDGVLVKHLAAA